MKCPGEGSLPRTVSLSVLVPWNLGLQAQHFCGLQNQVIKGISRVGTTSQHLSSSNRRRTELCKSSFHEIPALCSPAKGAREGGVHQLEPGTGGEVKMVPPSQKAPKMWAKVDA